MTSQHPFTTTDAGIPAASDEHSLTVGPDGPILLQDHYLHREDGATSTASASRSGAARQGRRRVRHFEVTQDVSAYTRAAVFQPGAPTEMLIRFSTVAGERGSPDTWRDPRGFALKFYTDEGNYDMVGNNTPVFFIRDPMKFQHFIRSQKRRADNDLRDHDMQWDFWTLSPESAHQVTWLMGDRGHPADLAAHERLLAATRTCGSTRPARSSGSSTTSRPTRASSSSPRTRPTSSPGEDPDYHQRDLYEAISAGEFPSWTLKVQIMPFEDATTTGSTRSISRRSGRTATTRCTRSGSMTLNRNPDDYYAEIEQAAFEPNNLVPGIGL